MTSGSALAISAMQIDDLPEVMKIERQCYDFPWSEQILKDCLKVGYHALVLREQGSLRAFAFASSGAGEAHVLNICVDPKYRGQGYARALISQCIATVIVRGAKMMFLEVRESNQAAIALYESMGFVTTGRREDYYRRRNKADAGKATGTKNRKEDALLMSRDLTLIEAPSDF